MRETHQRATDNEDDMYEETHITHDAAVVEFDTDAEGIVETEDGETEIVWDDVNVVRVENPPHAEAFDTKRFHQLPATVAKPIPQPYQYGEDAVWLKKPREELRKAAWSLDNAPWTMGHPDTGMVKDVDDVRGFWNETHYIDSADDLDSKLHVPVGDDEAKEFIEENGDVSVGFYNRVARTDEYDGVVGGEDDGDIDLDGYQTDMLFDHCASVQVGRCPSSEGCGIDAAGGGDAHGHMRVDESAETFKSGTRITGLSDAGEEPDSDMQQTQDQPSGIKTEDGTWFAVGPGEHTKDSTDYPGDHMFPVDSCADVEDAWTLRSQAEDLSIEQSTLEERIKRAGNAMDCSDMPWESQDAPTMDEIAESADRYSISGRCADCGDNEEPNDPDTNTESSTMDIDFDDLSADAALQKVAEQHDGVAEQLEDLRSTEDVADKAEEAAEELDASVDDLPEAVGTLKDTRDELRARVDELEKPRKEEHAEYITERTDRFGERDDLMELDLDELEEKRELVEDLASDAETDETTANADGGDDSTEENDLPGDYAKTPWN